MINAGTNKQALIAMGKKLHGSALIEVLIALLVLSFGMMGMAGVQSVSLRGNQAAYFRTQATSLSMDIAERMRANLTGVGAEAYNNVAGAATASCFTIVGCTSAEMAAQDINDCDTLTITNTGVRGSTGTASLAALGHHCITQRRPNYS